MNRRRTPGSITHTLHNSRFCVTRFELCNRFTNLFILPPVGYIVSYLTVVWTIFREFSMVTPISILLINPWITDFAAYNFWAEPLGLLYVAAVLGRAGAHLSFIDCLFSGEEPNPLPRENGCSKYLRTIIEKPPCLDWVERAYARYGMGEDEFLRLLSGQSRPDAVLVTSMMTYWYPGVVRAIELVREHFGPSMPIVLGGVYAIICRDHAERVTGADFVYRSDDLKGLIPLMESITGKELKGEHVTRDFSSYPLPFHELGRHRRFFAVLTGKGCPFYCTYCASHLINRLFTRRSSSSVLEEMIRFRRTLHTRNVAFYDDALLADAPGHLVPLLQGVIDHGLDLSLHLPNGVHAHYMTPEIARLFHTSGVHTIRLGLETARPELQVRTGNKTENREYRKSVFLLREEGYTRSDVGTYVMLGLPGQTPGDVEESLNFVYRSGASPHLSSFSPIPGTAIWEEALKTTRLAIGDEPLLQNNTVFILGNAAFSRDSIQELKQMALALRNMP
jgi:hypothetical protein